MGLIGHGTQSATTWLTVRQFVTQLSTGWRGLLGTPQVWKVSDAAGKTLVMLSCHITVLEGGAVKVDIVFMAAIGSVWFTCVWLFLGDPVS